MSGSSDITQDGKCSAVEDLLSPYLDGVVTPAEKALVEEHAAACPRCAEELDSLRFTVGILQKLPNVEVPRAFTLQAPARQQTTLFNFFRNASATLVAVLLVLFGGSLYLRSTVPQAMPASYSRTLPAEEPETLSQSGAAGPQRLESQGTPAVKAAAQAPTGVAEAPKKVEPQRALAPQSDAREQAPMAAAATAPAAVDGVPATAQPPATAAAPRAAAKPSPQAATGAERAPVVPAEPPPAPSSPSQGSTPRLKGGSAEGTVGADTAAKAEFAQAPQAARQGEVTREQDARSVETRVTQATEPRWPLLEAEIGVGVLLALCAGATLILWARRKYF